MMDDDIVEEEPELVGCEEEEEYCFEDQEEHLVCFKDYSEMTFQA